MPSNYVYTSSDCKLDTKVGRKLCEELELTWKYPKLGKVITLSPDCKGIFQDLKALKVISPGVSGDILLAEAIFAHNSKITYKRFRVEIYYCISLQVQIIASASWAETSSAWWIFLFWM